MCALGATYYPFDPQQDISETSKLVEEEYVAEDNNIMEEDKATHTKKRCSTKRSKPVHQKIVCFIRTDTQTDGN
jgi:hypothetical protein